MRKLSLTIMGIILGVILTLAVLRRSLADEVQAQSGAATPPGVSLNSDESSAQSALQGDQGDENTPTPLAAGPKLPAVLPTPIPGETLVYFVPSDNDATATVIYLYNTDTVAHIVALRGFSYNGVLVYSLNINVGATSILRLASDSIASAPPPSWATPAPIITNFTDFTYFASLSLPQGVTAEGYTLFNPGTGVADPRADQGAIPLDFSPDPSTLLPTPTATQPSPTPSPTQPTATQTSTPTQTLIPPTPTQTLIPPTPTQTLIPPTPTPLKLYLPSIRNTS